MARMYSRKKGKSKSTKPIKQVKPIWVRYSAKEIESLIVKLSKAGKTASQIGLILRDAYGVPAVKVLNKKKITKILEENKLRPELPEDLNSLIRREIKLIKHLEPNKKDYTAKRGLQITESKIHKLTKYYKRTKRLPADWTYDREKAKLIIG